MSRSSRSHRGGEAPAAPDGDAKVGALSEKEANAHSESVGRIETGGSEETEALMTVKVELALANMEENGLDRTPDEKRARNVIGGKMCQGKIRMRASCSPTGQSAWGARV